MNLSHMIALALLATCTFAQAQQPIYRCGNEYTNDGFDAKNRGCKLVAGGNLTVVPSLVVRPSVASPANQTKTVASLSNQKVDSNEQRSRDADAQRVLEAELRKTEQKRDQLKQEFNNGQPEKMAAEVKNYQKYLDRVADMRNQITRLETDIASLRRELGRASAKSSS